LGGPDAGVFLKNVFPRTLVIPEALFTLAEVNLVEGRKNDAVDLFRQLAGDYGYTEWGKRASARLRGILGGVDDGARSRAQR
jgi:TolA-binding protein